MSDPRERAAMPPTSRDVARVAGVSQSTVSYVLSGKRQISETTRKKVADAILELSYHPNSGARALKSRRSNTIALMIPVRADTDMAGSMAFIVGMASAARQHGYDILVVTDDEGPDGLQRVARTSACDGIVIMSIDTDDPRIAVAASLDVPAVLVGVPDDRSAVCKVDLDFNAAGERCLSYLAAAGHRHIAILEWQPSGRRRPRDFLARLDAGIERAASALGIEPLRVRMSSTVADAQRAVTEVYRRAPETTAFLLQRPSMPPHVARALEQRGLRIGVDVSTIGITRREIAEQLAVPMTSVDLDPAAVSRAAIDLIVSRIELDKDVPAAETRLIPPRLVVRESVADLTGARAAQPAALIG